MSGWLFGSQQPVPIVPPNNGVNTSRFPQSQIWPANPYMNVAVRQNITYPFAINSNVTTRHAGMADDTNMEEGVANPAIQAQHDQQRAIMLNQFNEAQTRQTAELARKQAFLAVMQLPHQERMDHIRSDPAILEQLVQDSHLMSQAVNDFAGLRQDVRDLSGRSTPTPTLTQNRNTRPLTAPHSIDAAKLCKPKKLVKAITAKLKQNPASTVVRRTLMDIFLWVRRHYLLQYPGMVSSFIEDLEVDEHTAPFFESWKNEIRANDTDPKHLLIDVSDPDSLTVSEDELITSVEKLISTEVRPPDEVARQELLRGLLKQGSDTASQYAQRFYERSRRLPNYDRRSMCEFFLDGLKPALRTKCMFDRDNNRWTDLDTLVQFTYKEEERMLATASHYRDNNPDRSFPHPFRKAIEPPGKKAKHSHHQQRVAVVQADEPMEGDATLAAVNGLPQDGSVYLRQWAGKPRVEFKPGCKRNKPITECLAYDTMETGLKLLSWEAQDDLEMFGLCKACRVSNTHLATACTLEPGTRKGSPAWNTYKQAMLQESRKVKGPFNGSTSAAPKLGFQPGVGDRPAFVKK